MNKKRGKKGNKQREEQGIKKPGEKVWKGEEIEEGVRQTVVVEAGRRTQEEGGRGDEGGGRQQHPSL